MNRVKVTSTHLNLEPWRLGWIGALAIALATVGCAVAPGEEQAGRTAPDTLSDHAPTFAETATAGLQPAVAVPAKSPNDPYSYRYLALDNGLRVLLVSAPGSPKAAAALNVYAGSGENPPGRGGLAHFLEHMLFLGTDKYPDAGEYGRYISQHGGSQNAYTNFEHTNYFFDVEAQHLPGALDRFAQFFISPRFDAEYVDREKNAVEAEYRQSLNNDGRRELDVLQEVMNPAHPYSQIAVGTLETLADRPDSAVRDELIAFYEKHYRPECMALVVLGPQDLDDLQALATETFESVEAVRGENTDQGDAVNDSTECGPAPRPGAFAYPEPLFTDLPFLLRIQPNATRQTLKVSFPVGDYRADYDVKPAVYVANLVGHEGSGSLLSRLKAEGLAERLSAGMGLAWRGGALFNVTVSLTQKGVAQYERVVDLLFEYLDMLRAEGARAWLYEESAQLAELAFRFQQHGEPMGYVSALSTSLHYYDPEDLLRGPYAMDRFDAPMIDAFVASLVPDNALLTLTHPQVETDRVSRYYQVPFSIVGGRFATDIGTARDDESRTLERAAFALPAPNPFIPDDVSVLDPDPAYSEKPVHVLDRPGQSIWFGQEPEFRVPRGGIYVNFRSPLVAASPVNSVEAQMYVALLKDELNELTYPALLAGLDFRFYTSPWGISLRVSGYDDKQDVLLEKLLVPLRRPALDPLRFEDIRDRAVRGLQNRASQRPAGQAMARLNESLLHKQWSDEQQITALQAMTLADVRAFVERFWENVNAEVLVYGNYAPDTADLVSERLEALAGGRSASEGGVADEIGGRASATPVVNRVARIPASSDLLLPITIEHDDSVVIWYLQGPDATWRDRAGAALTAQVIQQDFFVQLRTERQLGYTASAFSFAKFDLPGLVMLIQSPVADAPTIVAAMRDFLGDVESGLDEDTFERHKSALLGDIRQPHKNLWERAEYYWQSMAEGEYGFDGREQLAAAVEGFGFDDWRAYFDREYSAKARSLKVVSPGKWGELPESGRVFERPGEIHDAFDYYEFP